MNPWIFSTLLLAITLGVVSIDGPIGSWQTQLGPRDGSDLSATDLDRIKIGTSAPDFTLNDHTGKPITLSSYRDKKAIVLVFYRGYW